MPPSPKPNAPAKARGGYLLGRLDASLGAAIRLVSVLVLPLALLLFLQWPLRELVQAYSREANDLAQIFFALYISLAITAATRQNGHLAADAFARRFRQRTRRRIERAIALLVLVPWSAFVLWAAWPSVTQSVRVLESFPETYNAGYFLVRASVGLLVLAVLTQGLIDVWRRLPADEP